MPIIKLLVCILLGCTLSGYSQTGIYAGLKGCNNSWDDNWVITPAPELTLTGKFIALSMDGTFGNYSPLNSPGTDIFQARASFIPMLRLPFLKSFFITAGYGVAYLYRRENQSIIGSDGAILNSHKYLGEIRVGGGFGVSLGSRISLIIKGGYSRINDENFSYSLSTGLLLKSGTDRQKVKSRIKVVQEHSRKPAVPELENETENAEPVNQRLYENAAVIHASDIILSEFNNYIEEILSQMKITITDWESLRLKLNEMNITTGETAHIARVGAEHFNLQAVIETNMRYSYKSTFGGDVIVHHASVRVLKADDGSVLSVLNFESANADLSVCKKYFMDHVDDLIYGVSKN